MEINNEIYKKQIENNLIYNNNDNNYNLGNKSRSMPALGSSTRSLHADYENSLHEDEDDEINYSEDNNDLSFVGKSASWACPREEINHPMYSSYSNSSIFDPPKYLPNPNSTLPQRGTFTRGPWHNNQPTLPKSPSLLFTVQFKSTTDTFSLLPTCPTDIHVGDFVKVEGDRGLDIGVVSEIYSEIMDISFTKKILCLATQEEIHYSLSKEKDEIAAVELCRALVARRGLSICIVDAEFQCDRKKLTFFFTSDRHTDFRELVRDLFATFKTRIWMQKIKAPVGHPHTPQLIRRPLPPTHTISPHSIPLNSNGLATEQSQPLYNVPKSLQSRAFMGSGADYPNRLPQTENIHAHMYPSTMIDPNLDYNLNSTAEFTSSPRNILPSTSTLSSSTPVPLQPLNENGSQQVPGRQSNSFIKPLVNRFKQFFHTSNQDERVIDEYLHNGFGVSQNGYTSQYEIQQQQQLHQHHQQQQQQQSISPSISGSYPNNYLYSSEDMYRGTTQLNNNLAPLSLQLDSSSISLSSPTSTQDTLSIFSASHINMNEMSVLPQTTSIASSISSNMNNINNNNNININNNNINNLSIISNPTILSSTSTVLAPSLTKSQFASVPGYQNTSHIDENLWLANVVAQQSSEQPVSSGLYNQSINSIGQNNLQLLQQQQQQQQQLTTPPPPPISSPYHSSSGDVLDQTLGAEQYNITNSLAGLSISAEPFVYRGSAIHMG